jgi:fused signal recognition particle receptor
LSSLKKSLKKSRDNLWDKYDILFTDAVKDKNDFLEKIEELLILSDLGPKATEYILDKFRDINLHQFRLNDFDYFKNILKKILLDMVPNQKTIFAIDPEVLNVIMVVGVNGTGKTSFVGKLAHYFKDRDKKVLVIPADTYRAGAISQLNLLAYQAGVETLKANTGADPASIVFDGIQSARAKRKELLIIDTAGRLHTYHNLMKELEKIRRVIIKVTPEVLLTTILVIDATTGQNGLNQALCFRDSLPISNLALTKLDGTAKGGIALTIQQELLIPVGYITFGEKITDICEYNPEEFIEAFLD